MDYVLKQSNQLAFNALLSGELFLSGGSLFIKVNEAGKAVSLKSGKIIEFSSYEAVFFVKQKSPIEIEPG